VTYIPKAFATTADAAWAMIGRIAVGHLVIRASDGFDATFLPILPDREAGVIHMHVARTNPMWRAIGPDGTDALLIVTGVDGYVSPSWYPSKADTGEVVPTWNYELVHVRGRLTVHDDITAVADIVRALTERHEARRADPWSVDDAPPGYLDRMHRAIVGLELAVISIEGKDKLSQNRTDADAAGVARALDTAGTERDQLHAAAVRAARSRA
jgi:transcriptional regulator